MYYGCAHIAGRPPVARWWSRTLNVGVRGSNLGVDIFMFSIVDINSEDTNY